MLLRNVNVSAFNAVFQTSPKALKAVNVAIAVHIFTCCMTNFLMLVALARKKPVSGKFIGVNGRTLGYIFLNNRYQTLLGAIRNDLGHDLTAPFQHSKNDSLILRSATAPRVPRPATSDIGFVDFN